MPTTFEKYSDYRANYTDKPYIDVEILPEIHHCTTCDELIEYHSNGRFGMGEWKHTVEPTESHWTSPKTFCTFCHSEDAVYRQYSWHDAVECKRCGGHAGYAIGD